jgi:hypothetical protein
VPTRVATSGCPTRRGFLGALRQDNSNEKKKCSRSIGHRALRLTDDLIEGLAGIKGLPGRLLVVRGFRDRNRGGAFDCHASDFKVPTHGVRWPLSDQQPQYGFPRLIGL